MAAAYDEAIINQLMNFNYARSDIIKAMDSIDDKNNINAITAFIDEKNSKLPQELEMKYETKTIQRKGVGIENITKQCKLVEDSGNFSDQYLWSNTIKNDDSWWASKDAKNVYIILDCGKNTEISAIFIQFTPDRSAESINILFSDTFNAKPSDWKLFKTIKTKQDKINAIGFGNSTYKQFIKIEFFITDEGDGAESTQQSHFCNPKPIGIRYLQIYGFIPNKNDILNTEYINREIERFENITKEITCISYSKTDKYSSMSGMYDLDSNSGDWWHCRDVDIYFMIMDTKNYNVHRWEMFMGNMVRCCNSVSFFTSDDMNGKWIHLKTGKPTANHNLNGQHKQFLKVIFNEVIETGLYVYFLQVLGEEKEEKETSVDDSKQSISDISRSVLISDVADSGTYGGYPISNTLQNNENYWMSESGGDSQWIVFDVTVYSIDMIQILKRHWYETSKVVVYTCGEWKNNESENNWIECIGATANVKEDTFATLKINGKNERYIKLLLQNQKKGYAGIQRLKFYGNMKVNDNTMDMVNIEKVSSCENGCEMNNVFNDKMGSYWSPKKELMIGSFMTFNCNGKEIDTIYVKFNQYGNCNKISVLMADISNDYAFQSKNVIKVFEFNTKLRNKLDIKSLNAYNNGYKQYLQLRFEDFQRSSLRIEQILLLGHSTTDNTFENEEKVSTIIDNEVETTSVDKINCIECEDSGSSLYPLQNIFVDNDSPWQSGVLSDSTHSLYFIFDCGDYRVRKLVIYLKEPDKCKGCRIYSSDTAMKWGEIGKISEMNKGFGAKEKIFKDAQQKKFLKIVFFGFEKRQFAIRRIKFIGNGLDEEYDMTLDQVLHSEVNGNVNQELIAKYLKLITKQRNENLIEGYAQLQRIENDRDKGPMSAEWMDQKRVVLLMPYTFIYNRKMAESKLKLTIYEETQAAKIAANEFANAEMEVNKKLKKEFVKWKTIIEKRDKMIELETEYLTEFKNQNFDKGLEKKEAFGNAQTYYESRLKNNGAGEDVKKATKNADEIEEKQEINAADTIDANRNEKIFQAWCDSVDNNPLKLDSNYSVQQYLFVVQWAKTHKTEEAEERYKKLANLLDEALAKQKQTMHKFHLFQLSEIYEWARPEMVVQTKNRVWVLFDCGKRKINKIKLVFGYKGQAKQILVDTSDVKEEKYSDEVERFAAFQRLQIADCNRKYNSQVEININEKNRQYLKLQFEDCDPPGQVSIKNIKFYIKSTDAMELDEDDNKTSKTELKNLTSHIKVFDHTKSDMFANNIQEIYSTRNDAWTNDADVTRQKIDDPKKYISERIVDETCKALNIMRDGKAIESNYKYFIKFLLCWQLTEACYIELLMTAKRVMNLLKKPLIIEYDRLLSSSVNSPILRLKLDEKDRAKDISTNLECLQSAYKDWYIHTRRALFWPKDLKPIADEWSKLGFEFDKEFKNIRRDDPYSNRSLCTSDDFAMMFLNCIAIKLNASFQNYMKRLFNQNRNKLNLGKPTDKDVKVHEGPVKTKSRQNIKIKLDYNSAPHPQCMAVLDIVRCAIVCENDKELCSLYNLIVSEFSQQIKRVKNAFADINKGTYGYRAVLMNIVYGDQDVLPYPKYRMICEVQLLLNKYYKVRGKMHLGYGIVRSEGEVSTKSAEKAPHYVLAQDSCKFGKLDI
eukprot:284137_1